MRRQILLFIFSMFILSGKVYAQSEIYFQEMTSEDYANLQLPPLSVLYENAINNPRVEYYHQDQRLALQMLKKQKRAWLSFFTFRAGYTYGVTDNYGHLTDTQTAIFYQYTGTSQHYYNIGGNISIPIEELFDLGGRIKRQRIEATRAEFLKLREYDLIKMEIIDIYVGVLSGLSLLKVASENIILGEGNYNLMEERFKTRSVELKDLTDAKFRQLDYLQNYEEIRSKLNSYLLKLEILSNTPIINK